MVRNLLNRDDIELGERFRQLSRICFSDDQGRPNNVTGIWGDLEAQIQSTVLDVCEQALRECVASPLPGGSTLSGQMFYESRGFREVIARRRNSFKITSELIRRWLPSVFITTVDQDDEVVAACYQAAHMTTEDVMLDAIRRDLESESARAHHADSLDIDYWSDGCGPLDAR